MLVTLNLPNYCMSSIEIGLDVSKSLVIAFLYFFKPRPVRAPKQPDTFDFRFFEYIDTFLTCIPEAQ